MTFPTKYTKVIGESPLLVTLRQEPELKQKDTIYGSVAVFGTNQDSMYAKYVHREATMEILGVLYTLWEIRNT